MGRSGVKSREKAVVRKDPTAACGLCLQNTDDELEYGKMYTLGSITVHYYCVLLSSCLVQNGADSVGVFGFLEDDILREIERGKKNKCSYCQHKGATLACCLAICKRQFHLPCGRKHNTTSMFHGNYQSFCIRHAPKQTLPREILVKSEERKKLSKIGQNSEESQELQDEQICAICYEEVDAFLTEKTFWPPCCAKDKWFHSRCVQALALNAGIHYLKCPLCNAKEPFRKALMDFGYYIPDRDASWELETNAFADIYERPKSCSADKCLCKRGREYDSCEGDFDLRICCVCGGCAVHAICQGGEEKWFVCAKCQDIAPKDLEALNAIELKPPEPPSPSESPVECIIMPSRMSLRRTKPNYKPCENRAPRKTSRDTEKPLHGFTASEVQASQMELSEFLVPLRLEYGELNVRSVLEKFRQPMPMSVKLNRIRSMLQKMNASQVQYENVPSCSYMEPQQPDMDKAETETTTFDTDFIKNNQSPVKTVGIVIHSDSEIEFSDTMETDNHLVASSTEDNIAESEPARIDTDLVKLNHSPVKTIAIVVHSDSDVEICDPMEIDNNMEPSPAKLVNKIQVEPGENSKGEPLQENVITTPKQLRKSKRKRNKKNVSLNIKICFKSKHKKRAVVKAVKVKSDNTCHVKNDRSRTVKTSRVRKRRPIDQVALKEKWQALLKMEKSPLSKKTKIKKQQDGFKQTSIMSFYKVLQ